MDSDVILFAFNLGISLSEDNGTLQLMAAGFEKEHQRQTVSN